MLRTCIHVKPEAFPKSQSERNTSWACRNNSSQTFFKHEEFMAAEERIIYLDNEAARVTLLRVKSNSPALELLAGICGRLELEMQCMPWYGRVPSKSNPADDPSRLIFQQLSAHYERRTPQCSPQCRILQNSSMSQSLRSLPPESLPLRSFH